MTRLRKVVLETMGNRALAEKAARHYSGVQPQDDTSGVEAPMLHKRRVVMAPLALLIAIFHALMLLPNLFFLLVVYFLDRDKSNYNDYRAQWDGLAAHWAKYPSCFIYKAVEVALYKDYAPSDVSSALEIGVYTGETAKGAFAGKQLQAGVEYNVERFLTYARGERLHDELYCADVRALPFDDSAFSDTYCLHSIDDMELSATEALTEMARVTRPGGGVYFSGVTLNFTRHNLLIQLLNACGLHTAASALFDTIYIGSFNHYDKSQWQAILQESGLEMIEYQTYVPFRLAGWFDLAYRPETILINLCGWRRWLEPISSSRIYRGCLYRATAAMLRLSRASANKPEGINFFIAAKRPSEGGGESSQAGHRPANLNCVRCGDRLEGDRTVDTHLCCSKCAISYPVVEGIPVLLDLNGGA